MSSKIFAAIDVGTTTVAVSLIDEENRILFKDGFLNPQQRYGSDVISRITLSMRNDNLAKMQECIIAAIEASVQKGCESIAIKTSDIERAVLNANTAMASVVLGKSIENLGKAPFTVAFSEIETITLNGSVPCAVLPGASAFIGADSASGAFYIPLKSAELLIDLGTNGEMILNAGDKVMALSAACGPAFENSTRASKVYGKTTLGAISYLIKRGELRRDLVLDDEFVENGKDVVMSGVKLHLTAKIIREIQLAVAAIYSSVVFLIEEAGLTILDINKVYIAGGFGFCMSLADAENIGLLPAELIKKAVIIGNTSLLAAENLAVTGNTNEYNEYRNSIITLQPGGNDRYEELFRDNMVFERR
ncbi:MAG: DUF4445 domain-containing protein [Eubacterium sp.]|nr:DUF4445 domain-containing protein [Eubacterium sp.]